VKDWPFRRLTEEQVGNGLEADSADQFLNDESAPNLDTHPLDIFI